MVISGSGNVAQYALQKAILNLVLLLSASDSNSYVIDENGIDSTFLQMLKEKRRARLTEYAAESNCYIPWRFCMDLAAATTSLFHVRLKTKSTVKQLNVWLLKELSYPEGANMPSDQRD